jgi:hypothetical protein
VLVLVVVGVDAWLTLAGVLVLVEEDDGGTEELEVVCAADGVVAVVVVPATEDLLALYL